MTTKAVSLYQRNGWWYARIKRPHGHGRSIRHWLRTKSESEAKQAVIDGKFEELARADAADALTRDVWIRMVAGEKIRVRDAIDRFREHRTIMGKSAYSVAKEATKLDQFVRFTCLAFPDFANASITCLASKHVAAWVNADDDTKFSYRKWRLVMLQTWLKWCVEQRWLMVNPATSVVVRLDTLTQEQLMTKSHSAFTDAEVRTMMAAVPRDSFWHGAMMLANEYGLSVGAVATLEDVNIVGTQLRFYRTKGRKMVNETLTPQILEWFAHWRTVRPSSSMSYLFPEQASHYLSGSPVLSLQFKRLCEGAGLEDRTFHGLRKTATAKRWDKELDQLGDKDKRALMSMVAKNGFAAVQRMLAHREGSSVTEQSYMPR